ncbi:MAG TPA: murein biosynthesis integral membrane protein MurJ [Gemmatimonadaceae bacterium]|nr:murein biosynthesis integral membrane protein MurJ [Gemmatimonadaceae bacterium]
MTPQPSQRGGGVALVATGILLSRIFGLVRGRLLGHFLGAGDAMDALTAAIRIPNILQNLFGEGVLSASFIPVYATMVAHGDEQEAGRIAGAIGALLALASTVLVLVGIAVAPLAIPLIAPGFDHDKRELTILLVRIMFPGVGLLVLSAWALGVLNSHGKFFLSYASPVAMNAVMIAALLWYGPHTGGTLEGHVHLVTMIAWASVAGSAAQLGVQLPAVWRVERKLRLRDGARPGGRGGSVATVFTNFLPVFLGRGVVQISGYVDGLIASLIMSGSVAMLGYAQVITMLPISLFGMSVSAAVLPEMSAVRGDDESVRAALRAKLGDALRRVAFYVVPSAVAFLALGDVIGAALYQTGEFTRDHVVWLWAVLAGSAVGLLAGTLGRLYASTWYALRDTRTPLVFAAVRVILTAGLGLIASRWLPGWLGLGARWGVAGLTASAGVSAWLEFALLRRSIARRIGAVEVGAGYLLTLWSCAVVAAVPAFGIKLAVGTTHPLALGLIVLPIYGCTYLALAATFGVQEVRAARGRIGRLFGRS